MGFDDADANVSDKHTASIFKNLKSFCSQHLPLQSCILI
jgi:hypothetical protein